MTIKAYSIYMDGNDRTEYDDGFDSNQEEHYYLISLGNNVFLRNHLTYSQTDICKITSIDVADECELRNFNMSTKLMHQSIQVILMEGNYLQSVWNY